MKKIIALVLMVLATGLIILAQEVMGPRTTVSAVIQTPTTIPVVSYTAAAATQYPTVNGIYAENGTYNGKPAYREPAGGHWLYYAGDMDGWIIYWEKADNPGPVQECYIGGYVGTATPPVNMWYTEVPHADQCWVTVTP